MYDISMAIEEDMLLYKNRHHLKPELNVLSDFNDGDSHETELKMNLHTGTHLDAPLHMLENGSASDNIINKDFLYRAKVLNLESVEERIEVSDLESFSIEEGDFVILKTKNSLPSYLVEKSKKFIYLGEKAAEFLVAKKVSGVGIDSLGIERSQAGHPTHKNILRDELLLLEGLRLNAVLNGSYVLILAPLKIPKSDAVPVRAALYTKEELLEKLAKF